MVTQRIDELAVSRFAVEIEGFLVATFTECSGLSGEVEVETYQLSLSQKWKLRIGGADRSQRVR